MQPDVVRFVSVLTQRPRLAPPTLMSFPSSGRWLLKILARQNRFVLGMYRRHMKIIGYLGALDQLYDVQSLSVEVHMLRFRPSEGAESEHKSPPGREEQSD